MSSNEFGEITNPGGEGHKKTPEQELYLLCQSGLTTGNVLPPGFELDEGATLYYKSHHIDEMKSLLDEIRQFSSQNKIEKILNPVNNAEDSVQNIIAQIQRNIDFSERVNSEIKINPPRVENKLTVEEREKRRQATINKLRKNNDKNS